MFPDLIHSWKNWLGWYLSERLGIWSCGNGAR